MNKYIAYYRVSTKKQGESGLGLEAQRRTEDMERPIEKFRAPVAIFLAVIVLSLLAFSIQTAYRNMALEHPLAKFFPVVAVLFILIVLFIVVANIINHGWRNVWKPSFIIQAMLLALLFAFISIILYPIYLAFLYFIEFVKALDNDLKLRQYIVGAAALVSGIVLFLFRLYFRSTYGLTEAVVGVSITVQKVSGSSFKAVFEDTELFVVFLTAGVYLVVRGLDNIHQGLVKDPKDRIAEAILKRILKMGEDGNGSISPAVADPSRADLHKETEV